MSWLSSITGMDAAHNAGKLGDQSQQQAAEAAKLRAQAGTGYTNLTNLGLADVTQAGGYGQIANQGGAQIAEANQALPGVVSGYENATGVGNTDNPYQLTAAQQTQLNTNVDALTNQQTASLAHYNQSLAARGIIDPQASGIGAELIKQHYAGAIESHKADFAEQARKTRADALTNLMSYYTGSRTQGIGAQEAGVAGAQRTYDTGLSGTAGLANSAQSGSAQSQSQAAQQQDLANSQFNSLLKLGTFAATGGFNAPSTNKAKTTTYDYAPETADW